MTAIITTPAKGRGAWPTAGTGGTLRLDGQGPGKYYRAPAENSAVKAVGVVAWQADRNSTECSMNDYAVWRAAMGVQVQLREQGFTGPNGVPIAVDGIWGKNTDIAVKAFQTKNKLTADGIFGPASAKALFRPLVQATAADVDSDHPELVDIMIGTVNLESMWDPGAVGVITPQDLGLGQINGPAHPTLSANDRLNPKMSLPWIARFIDANLAYFKYNVRHGIAAYNLGRAGATRWIAAGEPDAWGTARPNEYIDKVLAGA